MTISKRELYIGICLAVMILIGVLFGGRAWGSNVAYERGYAIGYDQGYQIGKTEGKELGYREGEGIGYERGKEAGYSQGYGAGDTAGYDRGYEQGDAAGYDRGYSEGKTVGYQGGRDSCHWYPLYLVTRCAPIHSECRHREYSCHTSDSAPTRHPGPEPRLTSAARPSLLLE